MHSIKQQQTIFSPAEWTNALTLIREWQDAKQSIVFTNGCFDILHIGHIQLLTQAKKFGNKLVIGLNSDSSVQQLKGPTRPINKEIDRATILTSLKMVTIVIIFTEQTPLKLIQAINPDILVKGGDYQQSAIIGAKEVKSTGGKVAIVPFINNYSTSQIIKKKNIFK